MSRMLLVALFGVTLIGCGGNASRSMPMAKKEAFGAPMAPPGQAREADMADLPPAADQKPVNHVQEKAQDAPPPADKVKRKIKYTADFRLITEEFPKAEDGLREAIEANDGFISFADVSLSPGQPRSGTWKARIPVAKFEEFRKAVKKIAEVERESVNTEDVTAQFYDLESHIKNQKAQEDALRELLKKTTDKMENMLAVQRELSNVRNSIERSEGQLRLLANLTDLTTVTIHLQERRKYVPEKGPEQAEKPTFGTRVSHTFGESWNGFVNFFQDVAIAIVALTPWLPVILIVAAPIVFLVRRTRKAIGPARTASKSDMPAQVEPSAGA